jgi:hypothetical protein
MLTALAMRKAIDPEAPDVIAFPEPDSRFKRALKWEPDPWLEEKIINTMVEAQRLTDAVVDAAIDWHKSDMDESMDAAQTLEDAIEALIEFRRKMPIVKQR